MLGSASPDLLRQTSESLAGRIAFHHLPGLDLEEVGSNDLNRLWFRGGFPRSYLSRTHTQSQRWLRDFILTFFERDLPGLGITIPPHILERFWAMLCHYHGQVWNSSEFARSFGVSHRTVRKYLDILTSAFVVRGRHRQGFEIKRTDTPCVTASMRVAMDTLRLKTLDVIHAGRRTFPLAHRIRAIAAADLLRELQSASS